MLLTSFETYEDVVSIRNHTKKSVWNRGPVANVATDVLRKIGRDINLIGILYTIVITNHGNRSCSLPCFKQLFQNITTLTSDHLYNGVYNLSAVCPIVHSPQICTSRSVGVRNMPNRWRDYFCVWHNHSDKCMF